MGLEVLEVHLLCLGQDEKLSTTAQSHVCLLPTMMTTDPASETVSKPPFNMLFFFKSCLAPNISSQHRTVTETVENLKSLPVFHVPVA